ncbi:hypothetical protein CTI14_02365, partial [Methylobacterium radiotolerans]
MGAAVLAAHLGLDDFGDRPEALGAAALHGFGRAITSLRRMCSWPCAAQRSRLARVVPLMVATATMPGRMNASGVRVVTPVRARNWAAASGSS